MQVFFCSRSYDRSILKIFCFSKYIAKVVDIIILLFILKPLQIISAVHFQLLNYNQKRMFRTRCNNNIFYSSGGINYTNSFTKMK